MHLERIFMVRHFTKLAELNIVTGLLVAYAYAVEPFMAWYGGDAVERGMVMWRMAGAYWPYFWIMTGCNAAVPMLYFWKKIRTSVPWLLAISLLINLGMWLERYVIIVTPLSHDWLPSSWALYHPRWPEMTISFGAACFFMFAFLVAIKLFPAVAISESKLIPQPEEGPQS